MRNHNQKARDMSRSVLPSTAGKYPRTQRRHIHKRERARVRAALHEAQYAEDDNFDDSGLHFDDRAAITAMVYGRREADKIGPLTRWAAQRTEQNPELRDQDPGGRLAAFARVLPNTLIGRHALSHLEAVLDPDHDFLNRRSRIAWGTAAQSEYEKKTRDAVNVILDAGAHRELNATIKKSVGTRRTIHYCTPDAPFETYEYIPRRYLAGRHDVSAFAEYVAADRLVYVECILDVIGTLNLSGPGVLLQRPVYADPSACS